MSTYFIRTYGCQQNIHDSEKLESLMYEAGFGKAVRWQEADLVLLNSCSVRQGSDDKIYGFGKELLQLRKAGKNIRVIVTGCLVGSAAGIRKRFTYAYLLKKMPWADGFLPNDHLDTLPFVLTSLGFSHNLQVDNAGEVLKLIEVEPSRHAYVTVSTGCDNFCTYCVVPYSRGEEISRSKAEIIQEINNLIKKGMTKVTLLGQNVNSWGLTKEEKFAIRSGSDQKLPFASLLREIHTYPEIERISFLSSNPFDFTTDLIDALSLPRMERYVHIALQSGDDETLRRMNRRHTAEEYIRLIQKIREKVPEIHIGTDLIVGFPSESVEAFENTVSLCRKIGFNVAFVSKYSPRIGTISAGFNDDISKTEKERRHKRLMAVINSSKNVKKTKKDAKK